MNSLELLLGKSTLDIEHQEDLMMAAAWHDADYAVGKEGHESRSADFAALALEKQGLSEERIERVRRLIMSTAMGHSPVQADEGLIKDADLSHLGSSNYMEFYDGLYRELNHHEKLGISEEEWREMCIRFMESMEYHSPEARSLYEAKKTNNLNKLRLMEPKEGESPESNQAPVLSEEEQKRLKEEKKRLKKERKKNEPKYNAEKGIETMFRLSLKNHITLSRIADDKANTLISVNAIILSIVLSALFPKLDSNPWLLYAGLSLILVSITTIIMATLSTIPKTTHGEVSKEDVRMKRGNLLFFGNFHKMTLPDYEWGIGELMKDGEYLYGSLTRDLYFLGKVLNRKYSLLRYAYFVFVIGLVVSIILFVWSVATLAPEIPIPEITTE
jgi:predicted metal-dependent HD superfamily phosphohydrolase